MSFLSSLQSINKAGKPQYLNIIFPIFYMCSVKKEGDNGVCLEPDEKEIYPVQIKKLA
jgi:hypothetical protein